MRGKGVRAVSFLLLSFLMLLSGMPAAIAPETDFEQLSTREKLIRMAGRVPDHFCVILEEGVVDVSEEEFYEVAEQLRNDTFDPSQYRSRISMSEASRQ